MPWPVTLIAPAGRLHHLAIAAQHRGNRVLALIDETTATITRLQTGELLAVNSINPARTEWRDEMKEPGRWPGSS